MAEPVIVQIREIPTPDGPIFERTMAPYMGALQDQYWTERRTNEGPWLRIPDQPGEKHGQ